MSRVMGFQTETAPRLGEVPSKKERPGRIPERVLPPVHQLSDEEVVARFIAAEPWVPSEETLQEGRRLQVEMFEHPRNVPLVRFAQLAHKSRQQIYKDIAAKKLLALNVGTRGQRLPDWQLHPNALSLTQMLMKAAPMVDEWTLYMAMLERFEMLDDRSAIPAIGHFPMQRIVEVVLNRLNII